MRVFWELSLGFYPRSLFLQLRKTIWSQGQRMYRPPVQPVRVLFFPPELVETRVAVRSSGAWSVFRKQHCTGNVVKRNYMYCMDFFSSEEYLAGESVIVHWRFAGRVVLRLVGSTVRRLARRALISAPEVSRKYLGSIPNSCARRAWSIFVRMNLFAIQSIFEYAWILTTVNVIIIQRRPKSERIS